MGLLKKVYPKGQKPPGGAEPPGGFGCGIDQ